MRPLVAIRTGALTALHLEGHLTQEKARTLVLDVPPVQLVDETRRLPGRPAIGERLAALLAIATTVVAADGCTTTDTPSNHLDASGAGDEASDGADGDAHGTATADSADGDAGPCTDSLATVSATYGMDCPSTYEGAVAFVCGIPSTFAPALRAGQCGGLAAVAYNWQSHWKVCVYDGVDSGTLVGVEAENDITSFCNNTSFTVIGGRVPDSCRGSLSISPLLATLDASCPTADAATDAEGDSVPSWEPGLE